MSYVSDYQRVTVKSLISIVMYFKNHLPMNLEYFHLIAEGIKFLLVLSLGATQEAFSSKIPV